MPAVGGFVFDSAGAPVDRELRLYRRDTGALLGKARSSGGDGDPHFDKVSLLLPCDGEEGSKLLVDSSLAQRAVTATGAASITKTVSKFGGSSLKFTGDPGAVSTPMDAGLQLGTGDFTVEMWAHITKAAQKTDYPRLAAVGKFLQQGGWNIVYLKQSATLFLDLYGSGSVVLGLSCGVPMDNAWNHIRITRSGTTFRTFLNGAVVSTGESGLNLNSQEDLVIGASSGEAINYISGYVDDFCLTKGVARSTEGFTPPTAPSPETATPGRTLAFGEYYFVTTHTGEVQVVCMDNANEPLENDLILRTFPV